MSRHNRPQPAGAHADRQHDNPTAETAGSPQPRRWLFRGMALLLPLVLVAVAEVVCRLAGYGGYPPVMIKVAEDGPRAWYATNRPGTDTFFDTRRSLAGGMRELHVVVPKPAGTYRIVLLGESAMQGFPQELPLTDGEFLAAMLTDATAGKAKFEVLNLAATAVASFPVLSFLDEALALQPDLVVVMCGNNEFFGAYGVASLHSGGRSPGAMRFTRWLRGLGLVQWVRGHGSPDERPRGTLMEQVVVQKQIAADDSLRTAAAKSLRENLSALVERCRASGVRVMLCTVPTNEEGLAPIGDEIEPDLLTAQVQALGRRIASAEAVLNDDPARAESELRAVLKAWPSNARAHFLLGKALDAAGRRDDALGEFIAARDLDTMPWRATSAAQTAIRAAAQQGAALCDMEAAFRADSPGGAVGWELMDDHVHFSVRGQALFARTLVDALAAQADLHAGFTIDPDRLAAGVEYARRLGQSMYTDFVAVERLHAILGVAFMRKHNEAALSAIETRRAELLAGMSERDQQAIERWRDPRLKGYTDFPLALMVGGFRLEDGDYASAEGLFRTARACVPLLSLWRLQCDWYILKCHGKQKLEPTGEDGALADEAIMIGELLGKTTTKETTGTKRYLGLVYNITGHDAEAVAALEFAARDLDDAEAKDVVVALVDSYVRLNRRDDARSFLRRAAANPQLAPLAQQLLEQFDH